MIDHQIWASGFFLTEKLTPEIINDYSWDGFDAWIGERIADPFQEMSANEVWDLIHHLASYKLSTERYGL